MYRTIIFLTAVFAAIATASPGEVARYDGLQADVFMARWQCLGPIMAETGQTAAAETAGGGAATRKLFTEDLLADVGGEIQVSSAKPSDKVDPIKLQGKEFSWQLHESEADSIDLDGLYNGVDWSVAYALCSITMPEETAGTLGVGSDDAIRIWLNGELVHDHWSGRPLRKDNDLVPVQFKQGDNQLLLKVADLEGDWGFSCRLLSAKSLSTHLVRSVARGDEDAVEKHFKLGTDLNARDKLGLTAWQTAKMRGFGHLADRLDAEGADSTVEMPEPQKLAGSLLAEASSEDAPGVCVLVSRGDEILFNQGFGLANLAHDVPIASQTKFRIGSVTKQFTASAIMKLAEEGKLSIDDKLSKFLPDFPRSDEVTIHHLLTHTSGIKSYTSKPDFLEHVANSIEPAALIDSFKNDEFDFDPGTKFAYNNSGYFLLGYIVQKVSGLSLGDYLDQTFFAPIGMSETGIHNSEDILKHEASGYAFENGRTTKTLSWDMSHAGGAGAIYSTVGDLHKWNEALFGGRVLSTESLAEAFTPAKLSNGEPMDLSYGYGWIIDEQRGLKRISHSGGLHGFLTKLSRYPDQQLSVVVFHNASPPNPELSPEAISQVMAECFLWQEMKPRPRYEVDPSVDPKLYERYVGRYDYGNSAVMEVTVEDNKLMAQLSGQPKVEIFPRSETDFFWKVVDAQVRFLMDEDGNVTAAEHTQNGRTFKAPKLTETQVVELSEEQLDALVGVYDFKPVGKLTIERKDGQLMAKMAGQPSLPIFPKSELEFFWKVVQAELEFAKDEDGKVTTAELRQAGLKFQGKRVTD